MTPTAILYMQALGPKTEFQIQKFITLQKTRTQRIRFSNPTPLHESSHIHVPYMVLGDKAFPLTHYCLRPFSGFTERGSAERIFNQRHSIARGPVETAYGIHSGRFRVLRKPIELNEEN